MDKQIISVTAADIGIRQDVFLAGRLSGFSRSRVMKLLLTGSISSNHQEIKAGYRVRQGDVYVFIPPVLQELALDKEAIPLDIIYQDSDMLVVNEPAGMVVHPAVGNKSGTLVNAMLACVDNLSGINGVARPGIVHRIDKDTSGLLAVAKNDAAHTSLSAQIAAKQAQRHYIALVYDNLRQDQGRIDAPIRRSTQDRKKMTVGEGGRSAVTHWQVQERFGRYTLLQLRLETGRTHQIRVHLASIGHPIVGDQKYAPPKNEFKLTRQFLHAFYLGLHHPVSGDWLEFFSPLPEDLATIKNVLLERRGDS